MAKTLITIGIIFVVVGLCWPLLQKLNLGRLPGDFDFKSGNFKFYFPLTTCIVISVVLSILLWIFKK
jgi:heme/copper-type cytochrome/quinol oxidase subunit 4